jgi:hypothetical protein
LKATSPKRKCDVQKSAFDPALKFFGACRGGGGGQQNASLGRAVIGGLAVATVATLLFVPTVFSVLNHRHGVRLA